MKLRVFIFLIVLSVIAGALPVAAQTDSVIAQLTSSTRNSFANAISGDGRFVVFESSGNVATENPRNSDGNIEIFLWDFAQRRIYQITNTRAVLKNTFGTATQDNIKIDIVNRRPVISQNGLWIAFASNATASTVAVPDASNPGSFNGNDYNTQAPPPCTLPSPTPTPTPTATPTPSSSPTPTPSPTSTPFNNPLSCDANMEVWLYQIPAYGPADLHSGAEIAPVDLSTGIFSPVTNTVPSRLPQEGTSVRTAFVADDNHDASINDDGETTAFVSTRDLVAGGNPFPAEDNDEIFTYVRGTAITNQITLTTRGVISNPIYNKNPVISGDGSRVMFVSTGDDPIDDPNSTTNFDTGSNPLASRNEEVFYADLVSGAPTGGKQVTTTTPTNPGEPVNLVESGKRMSRNGQFLAFDSFADLANENAGANFTSFATYLYDATANTFRRIGARSTADAAASGGDVARYPGFTDYDMNGVPSTFVLETRLNIKPDGTVAATASDGLNNDPTRPVQIYTYPLNVAPAAATFSRITKFPISSGFLAQTQPMTSDSSSRLVFNLGLTELGGGNSDNLAEVFYLYVPAVTSTATEVLQFVTGASQLPITPTTAISPTPTPTATPSPTPTPTPTPTPSPTGTPVPTPTPVTPVSVQGISNGMLAKLDYAAGFSPSVVPATAVGSLLRSPTLPIELSGVSMTINGYACGIRAVTNTSIEFVVPIGLSSGSTSTGYPVVINNQGTVIKGFVTLVPARPDIFNDNGGPGGRAQALNVTNRVHTPEPFTVRTIKIKGGVKVPTVIRLRLTGVHGAANTNFNIRIGDVVIAGTQVISGGVLVEPGVYTVDFQLPPTLNGRGDQPIVVTIVAGSSSFSSRLDDTAPRIFIL